MIKSEEYFINSLLVHLVQCDQCFQDNQHMLKSHNLLEIIEIKNRVLIKDDIEKMNKQNLILQHR